MSKKVNWVGDFTAVVTPFKENGDINEKAFCQNIETLMDEGVDGFVICGATGEPWSLNDEETFRCFELAAKTCDSQVVVIGGCTDVTPQRVMDKAALASKAKLNGIMVQAPYYAMPTLPEVREFYEIVSDNVSLPILVYNNPDHQGFNMEPQFLADLADIDNVVGIKQSSPEFMDVVHTARLASDKLCVFSGYSITRGLPSMTLDIDGFVGSKEPQILGREGVLLYDAFMEGDLETAKKIQAKCLDVAEALKGMGSFAAGLKAAMNILGRPGGYPRRPHRPLTSEEMATLRERLMKIIG